MGIFSGPDISESGLVFALDAGNKKSFANSLINSTSWSLGSGGASGYGANGPTSENERIRRTDPFGRYANVWETRPSGDGGADGGWNTSWFNIDNTKLHRFSVWVRRTSVQTSGGTFYLGLYGNNSGVRRTDNNAYEGNPYWECSGTSKFSPFIWYLVVGHCYPYNTTYTGQHPETGIYTVTGGATKVLSVNACNIGADVKWAGSDVTQAIHRCYHYYCGDSTTRLQLFDPRVDVVDGTEPSIKDLLSGYTASKLADMTKLNTTDNLFNAYYIDLGMPPLVPQSDGLTANDGIFVNGPTYNNANGGSIIFDGGDQYAIATGSGGWGFGQNGTVEQWVYVNGNSGNNDRFWCVNNNSSSLDAYLNGGSYNVYFHGGSVGTTTTIPQGTWVHFAVTYTGGVIKVYFNSVEQGLTGTTTGYNITNNGQLFIARYISPPYELNGRIASMKIYNRSLTTAEIQQSFNALRSRFGL